MINQRWRTNGFRCNVLVKFGTENIIMPRVVFEVKNPRSVVQMLALLSLAGCSQKGKAGKHKTTVEQQQHNIAVSFIPLICLHLKLFFKCVYLSRLQGLIACSTYHKYNISSVIVLACRWKFSKLLWKYIRTLLPEYFLARRQCSRRLSIYIWSKCTLHNMQMILHSSRDMGSWD